LHLTVVYHMEFEQVVLIPSQSNHKFEIWLTCVALVCSGGALFCCSGMSGMLHNFWYGFISLFYILVLVLYLICLAPCPASWYCGSVIFSMALIDE
jgi:hypothetical protein